MALTEHDFPPFDGDRPAADLLWQTTARQDGVFTCPILSLGTCDRTGPGGRSGRFVVMHAPDWVTLIPVFRGTDGVMRFVIERQYRHGIDRVSLEFPAGLVDKGETPEQAARRELLEETGLVCSTCTLLGTVAPNSAFMDNRCSFFLMEGLEKVAGQNLDATEQIEILTMTETDAISLIGKGQFDNGMMACALGFYLRDVVSKRSKK